MSGIAGMGNSPGRGGRLRRDVLKDASPASSYKDSYRFEVVEDDGPFNFGVEHAIEDKTFLFILLSLLLLLLLLLLMLFLLCSLRELSLELLEQSLLLLVRIFLEVDFLFFRLDIEEK